MGDGFGLTRPPGPPRIRGSLFAEGYPSGQREQTVNLPAYAFEGSNPSPTIGNMLAAVRSPAGIAGVAQLVERKPSKLDVAGSSPVSRSGAVGAGCRGLELVAGPWWLVSLT